MHTGLDVMGYAFNPKTQEAEASVVSSQPNPYSKLQPSQNYMVRLVSKQTNKNTDVNM